MTNNAIILDGISNEVTRKTLTSITNFQGVIQSTLEEGHDFGVIPGTGNKPTLLKPGAEKILMLLGLTSSYEITAKEEDWERGLFAYTIRCSLHKNGQLITQGVGSCNSRESKYRYRWVQKNDIPAGVNPNTLKTKWGKYRVENDDIYDLVNTLLKMAKKRAQIDAVLTVASLSEVFTQDLDDVNIGQYDAAPPPQQQQNYQQQPQQQTRRYPSEPAEIYDAPSAPSAPPPGRNGNGYAQPPRGQQHNNPGDFVLDFGKYKGRTLSSIHAENQGYIPYVIDRTNRQDAKEAMAAFLAIVEREYDNGPMDPPFDENTTQLPFDR